MREPIFDMQDEIESLRTQLAEAVALLQDVPEQPKDHEGYSPGWYWNIRTFIAAYDAAPRDGKAGA